MLLHSISTNRTVLIYSIIHSHMWEYVVPNLEKTSIKPLVIRYTSKYLVYNILNVTSLFAFLNEHSRSLAFYILVVHFWQIEKLVTLCLTWFQTMGSKCISPLSDARTILWLCLTQILNICALLSFKPVKFENLEIIANVIDLICCIHTYEYNNTLL